MTFVDIFNCVGILSALIVATYALVLFSTDLEQRAHDNAEAAAHHYHSVRTEAVTR